MSFIFSYLRGHWVALLADTKRHDSYYETAFVYTLTFSCTTMSEEISLSQHVPVHTLVFLLIFTNNSNTELFFVRSYFIHFSMLNSMSIILFWENTGSASENYEVFEISNHSFYFSM